MQGKGKLTNKSASPLRYPGGKGKISRFVANVLSRNGIHGTYVEPFAGGAGVAVNLLLSDSVDRIVINDLDPGVYSFWKTLVRDPTWLMKQVGNVPFTYGDTVDASTPGRYTQYWLQVRERYDNNEYTDMREKGFDFFMLNRMNVSGIVKGGPVGGLSQDGKYNISSRFNRNTLLRRIASLAQRSDRITVTSLEASDFCSRLEEGWICGDNMEDCLVFADPPYYEQGRHLYNAYATDTMHGLIADSLLEKHSWRWLLTYDEAEEIDSLYPADKVHKFRYDITYSANKRGRFSEFMFTSPNLNVASFDNVELHPLN